VIRDSLRQIISLPASVLGISLDHSSRNILVKLPYFGKACKVRLFTS